MDAKLERRVEELERGWSDNWMTEFTSRVSSLRVFFSSSRLGGVENAIVIGLPCSTLPSRSSSE